jgi:hypothetical protein
VSSGVRCIDPVPGGNQLHDLRVKEMMVLTIAMHQYDRFPLSIYGVMQIDAINLDFLKIFLQFQGQTPVSVINGLNNIAQIHLSGSFRNEELWAWHADRGYLSLDGTPMNVTGGLQKGKWDYVEPSFKDAWDEGEVFKCWFEHPMDKVDAGDAGYAYVIFPRTSLRQTRSLAQEWSRKGYTKDLKVLCNDVKCQAVAYKGTLAAVFHEPGTYVLDSKTYEISEPQVLICTSGGEDKATLPYRM